LQVNLSLGLLIVASFERREDARQAYFAREFFHREADSEPRSRSDVEIGQADRALGGGRRLEAGRYSGVWLNTNESSAGIKRVNFAIDAGRMMMRVFGVGESATSDWGEVEAQLFIDNGGAHGGVTFLASYDFGFMETCLHGWIKLGVLVIAKFDRFKDGSGRSNRFSREFFYRSGST
jgi:hypothetical protein